MKREATLLLVTLLTATACRGPDIETVEDLRAVALANDMMDLANDRTDILCECADEYRFASMRECREFFGYVFPEQHACIQAVVSTEPEGALDYLECAVELAEELAECLEPMACFDVEGFDRCHGVFREGTEGCPELPIEVLIGLRDCEG